MATNPIENNIGPPYTYRPPKNSIGGTLPPLHYKGRPIRNTILLNALESALIRMKRIGLDDMIAALVKLGANESKCILFLNEEQKYWNNVIIKGSNDWVLKGQQYDDLLRER